MTAPSVEPAKAATAPAAPPAATADSAVADKLRELVASRQFERLVNHKADRAGIEAFYSAHNYAPLWITNNAATRAPRPRSPIWRRPTLSVSTRATIRRPDFKSASTPDALAEAELKLTASALTFARHAQIGRIHFTRVGADIQFDLVAPEPADVLAKLADGNDAGKVLDGYNPPQAEFKALKAKLAELRKGRLSPTPKPRRSQRDRASNVAEGKILRPGMKDARVVALRKRLDIAGDKDNQLYDDAVRDAVKTFQTESDIAVDGNLGPNTVRALNGEQKEVRRASADPIDTIIVNMERWRWLPRNLGNPHVVVNMPDYSLVAVQRR